MSKPLISYKATQQSKRITDFVGGEVIKMGYNPQNAEQKAGLPADRVLDGTILNVTDGVVNDFLANTQKWKGELTQPCINVAVEVTIEDKMFKVDQLFTYEDDNGKTVFAPNSNMGKFSKKYGKLPQAGMNVRIATNNEGFGKIKLD